MRALSKHTPQGKGAWISDFDLSALRTLLGDWKPGIIRADRRRPGSVHENFYYRCLGIVEAAILAADRAEPSATGERDDAKAEARRWKDRWSATVEDASQARAERDELGARLAAVEALATFYASDETQGWHRLAARDLRAALEEGR